MSKKGISSLEKRGLITTDNNIKIEADEFIYDKSLNTLKLIGNIIINDLDQDLKIFQKKLFIIKTKKFLFQKKLLDLLSQMKILK